MAKVIAVQTVDDDQWRISLCNLKHNHEPILREKVINNIENQVTPQHIAFLEACYREDPEVTALTASELCNAKFKNEDNYVPIYRKKASNILLNIASHKGKNKERHYMSKTEPYPSCTDEVLVRALVKAEQVMQETMKLAESKE